MCTDVDVAGPAAVTGPHSVVMGGDVTLTCSVADAGMLATSIKCQFLTVNPL